MTGGPPPLAQALAALEAVGAEAGLPRSEVRAEGEALAAAVAESAPEAARDWSAQVGRSAARGLVDFFDAASRGRRWRAAPTRLLVELADTRPADAAEYARALTEVTTAACVLGEPTPRVADNAAAAAAAQLGAVPGAAAVGTGTGHDARRAVGRTSAARSDGQDPKEGSPTASAAATPESVDDLLAELDGLVGLTGVKREIHRQAALLRIQKLRAEHGMRNPTITRHLVFTGNPGTGKTTVARLVSRVYAALGLLAKGHLVEVDRSELVAGYLGQTAQKTSEVVRSALDGVLFIDEAYSLHGDQYGDEAVDTLVKEMEDHREDLVVIVAGYPGPMAEFVAGNPGLESRFRTTIDFDDYSDDEITAIFERLAAAAEFEPSPACLERFREILAATPRGTGFGNGRFARNLLEGAIGRLAWRLRAVAEPTREDLRILRPCDLEDLEDAEDPEDVEAAEQVEGVEDVDEAAAPAGPRVDAWIPSGGEA